MRISDWSSDVCSSDLAVDDQHRRLPALDVVDGIEPLVRFRIVVLRRAVLPLVEPEFFGRVIHHAVVEHAVVIDEDRKSVVVGKECVSTCRSRWTTYH